MSIDSLTKPKRIKPVKDDSVSVRVLRLRLKDKHDAWLNGLAREVNMVWNFINELSFKVLQREHRFIGAFELHSYTAGATKEGLSLHSQTVQAIADEYATRRKQFKKAKLSWRVSSGARRSLGWIPFKASAITYKAGQVHFAGKALSLWDSFGLSDYELGAGNISQDARGRWYLNICVKSHKWPCNPELGTDTQEDGTPRPTLGLDLGLKEFLVGSDGRKIEAQRLYRKAEAALAVAQRANKGCRVKAIHAKIANQRKDFQHKESTQLVATHSALFVGNVNASALAQTTMAKSVLDAGWSAFRTMLKYKCDNAGVWFFETNESYTTQECSCCHARTGPKGLQGLAVRTWTCALCGAEHDRDVNAARNIEARGLVELKRTIATAGEAKACEAVVNEVPCAKRDGAAAGYGRPAEGILVLSA